MKRVYLTWIFLLYLGGNLFAQEPLTIELCYQWAEENYPLIKQYDVIKQTEQYNLANASKGYLPQLSVNAKATYQSAVTKIPIEIPGMNITPLSKDQYQVMAEVNQTIWDGGTIRTSRDVLKAKAKADSKQVDTELYALNDRINQLYFGILLQDALLKQNTILQSDLQTNIQRIRAMIDNGVANESDLESMTVELLNARQKEIELKASRKGYVEMLAMFTGHPVSESSVLEVPVAGKELLYEIRRPELALFNEQANLLDSQNKQITAGIMPKFGLFVQGGYGRPGLNMLENDFSPFYIGGIRMSWNLGSLYTLKNDRKKIIVGYQSVDVQRKTFLFNTRLQQTQQQIEVDKMNELIHSDNEIVQLRTSIKKSAEVKLANGVISVTDLIREINAEDMARQSEVAHRIQRLMSIYNYNYTTNNQTR